METVSVSQAISILEIALCARPHPKDRERIVAALELLRVRLARSNR